MATSSFLTSETIIDDDKKTVTVSRLMQWFKANFGGTTGIKKIVGKYLKIDICDYKINYKKYNWEDHLNNISEKQMPLIGSTKFINLFQTVKCLQ